MIRIWEVDPHTRERTRELDLPFRPGPFEWGPQPRDVGSVVVPSILAPRRSAVLGSAASHEDVLTTPGDPFRFVVKEFLPAAAPAVCTRG